MSLSIFTHIFIHQTLWMTAMCMTLYTRCSLDRACHTCAHTAPGDLLKTRSWFSGSGVRPEVLLSCCQGCHCCLAYLCTRALRNQVLSGQFLPHMLKITSLSNLILTRAHDIVTSRSHWREGRKISWNKNITPWQIHWQECIAFHFLVLYKNILDVLTTDE